MAKTFYSKETVFDPDYRNVQAELWTRLSEDQQKVVASVFCHLKNHAQIEIAEALIDYIEAGVMTEFDNVVSGGIFNFLITTIKDLRK